MKHNHGQQTTHLRNNVQIDGIIMHSQKKELSEYEKKSN